VRFDAIVVPRGAETRAVEAGWPAPRPLVLSVPAGSAAGDVLERGPVAPTALVLGLCGALDPLLRVGDTVVYDRVIDGDDRFELDAEMTGACAVACDRAPCNAANVARFIGAVAGKAALRAATGAAVVDMEGAAIAGTLARRGVRVAMVRVVSDDAATELPNLNHVYDARGALRPAVLAFAFARAPRRSARFVAHALQALRALRVTAARLALSGGD
jgi:hypothetical protein